MAINDHSESWPDRDVILDVNVVGHTAPYIIKVFVSHLRNNKPTATDWLSEANMPFKPILLLSKFEYIPLMKTEYDQSHIVSFCGVVPVFQKWAECLNYARWVCYRAKKEIGYTFFNILLTFVLFIEDVNDKSFQRCQK